RPSGPRSCPPCTPQDQTESLLGRDLQPDRDSARCRRVVSVARYPAQAGLGGARDEREHGDGDGQRAVATVPPPAPVMRGVDPTSTSERGLGAGTGTGLTGLLRWALRGSERAEHAAVARIWLEQATAAGALVEVHTGSRRHRLDLGEAAVRAGDRGGEHHHSAPGLPGALLESVRTVAPNPVSRVRCAAICAGLTCRGS